MRLKFSERKILEWLKKKRFRIYVFIILSIFLYSSPSIPYANVFIDLKLATLAIIILFLSLFQLSLKIVFFMVSFLFLVCAFLLLLNQFERAEELANTVFSILFLEILLFVFKTDGKKKKSKRKDILKADSWKDLQ